MMHVPPQAAERFAGLRLIKTATPCQVSHESMSVEHGAHDPDAAVSVLGSSLAGEQS